MLTCIHNKVEVMHGTSSCAIPVPVYIYSVGLAGVTGGGGMLIIIATALITVSFIIIKTKKHASKKSG